MNYLGVNKCDTGNGPGIRVSLWVAGCNHKCEGCQNPESWNPNSGSPFTKYEENALIESLKKPFIKGLTISGGDPLFPSNREEILNIVKRVKTELPEKTIWLWTGYLWEEIKGLELMHYIDVIVDGPFILSQRDVSLPYSGSPNQRVIDVSESLKNNKIYIFPSR